MFGQNCILSNMSSNMKQREYVFASLIVNQLLPSATPNFYILVITIVVEWKFYNSCENKLKNFITR